MHDGHSQGPDDPLNAPVRTPVDLLCPIPRPYVGLPNQCYFLCIVPRCGSWLLACALGRIGSAGVPNEYFNDPLQQSREMEWGTKTLRSYVGALFAHATTPNGTFGVKITWRFFRRLLERVAMENDQGLSEGRALMSLFPNAKYLLMTRRNRVLQAISWYRAFETGEWWRLAAEVTHGIDSRHSLRDLTRIADVERMLIDQEEEWRSFFLRNRIIPYEIVYEDFVSDYEHHVDSVLSFLETPGRARGQLPRPHLVPQSSEDDLRLADLYLKYRRRSHG